MATGNSRPNVLLEEQGRHQFKDIPDGDADDWELFLADQGYGGQEYASGMTQNRGCPAPVAAAGLPGPLPRRGAGRAGRGQLVGRVRQAAGRHQALLAGLPIPAHMDQLSLIGPGRREYVYGEHGEGAQAMRMIRRGQRGLRFI